MELNETQRAMLLALWYKSGDWQDPVSVAAILNKQLKAVYLVAGTLKRAGLIEGKTTKTRVPGTRYPQYITGTYYRLTAEGIAETRKRIAIIEGKFPKGKL